MELKRCEHCECTLAGDGVHRNHNDCLKALSRRLDLIEGKPIAADAGGEGGEAGGKPKEVIHG